MNGIEVPDVKLKGRVEQLIPMVTVAAIFDFSFFSSFCDHHAANIRISSMKPPFMSFKVHGIMEGCSVALQRQVPTSTFYFCQISVVFVFL